MMSILNFIKKLFEKNKKKKDITKNDQNIKIYDENEIKEKIEQHITSIWDYLKCQEHTQAYHLVSVIPYDEWIDMYEIKRRIWDLFQIEYKNDRSLYPYLKTMVDLGLIETNNIGGKRKWRKKDLLIKLEKKKKEEEFISLKNKISTENNKNK